MGKSDDFLFFVCGSDQIWNATNLYLDPLYYLCFAPNKKKVAFSPSFGKIFVPKYNYKPIKKRIKKFEKLSSREESGADIIEEMTQRKAECLVDPTLLLDKQQWQQIIGNKQSSQIESRYILLYFLDEPNQYVINLLEILNEKGYEFISLNYMYNQYSKYNVKKVDAGPIEFLEYINYSEFILTDSFHGTVFSINLHKGFYVFNRNYGNALNQSTRILSILERCGLNDRLINNDVCELTYISESEYKKIDNYLFKERKHAKDYLLTGVQNGKK